MTVQHLTTLYDYSYWANQKFFAVIQQLPPDAFTQHVAGSYGSLRNTLVHMLSTEWGWLSRCGGPARPARLVPSDYPDAASLINAWATVEGYVRTFLTALTDADLSRTVEYVGTAPRALPLGELMHHAANHAVHHRGQVALLLRMLGYTPGNVDLLFYYAEQRGVPGW